jgi:hypothetical protein
MSLRTLRPRKKRKLNPKSEEETIKLFPSTELPHDIYYCIFAYLGPDLRPHLDFNNYAAVSKQWRDNFLRFIQRACISTVWSTKIFEQLTEKITGLILDEERYNSAINKQILNFRSLRELQITVSDIPPQFYSKLKKLTSLTSFSSQSIHHKHASLLLRTLTSLRRFDVALINDNDIQFFEEESYEELSKECRCSEKDVYTADFFKSLQRATKLEELAINFRQLPIVPICISTLTRLTSLSIGSINLDPCFPSHLSTLTNLEHLALPDSLTNYSAQQLHHDFAPLIKLRSLQNICYPDNPSVLDSILFQRLTKFVLLGLPDDILEPINLPHIKYLVINVAADKVSHLALLTTLQHLRITMDADRFTELTTLTNLHTLQFYKEASSNDWDHIYNYAKRMTNLSVVHLIPSVKITRKLPYSWQRIEEYY